MNMVARYLLFMLLVLSASLANACGAVPSTSGKGRTLFLDGGTGEYLVGRQLDVLEDASGQLNLDDVRAASDHFAPSQHEVPNMGVTHSVMWYRLQVHNSCADDERWLLEYADAMFQYLDVWVVAGDALPLHKQSGSMRVRTGDVLDTRGHVFEVDIPRGADVEIYIRAKTGYVHFVPVKLWSPVAFAEHQGRETLLHGLCLGMVSALLCFNLFVYFVFREKSYFYYVAYMAGMLVQQTSMNGMVGSYLLSHYPVSVNVIFIASITLTSIFSCLFSYHILSISAREKKFLTLMCFLMVMSLLVWVFEGYELWSEIVEAAASVAAIGLMVIGIRKVMQGDIAARFYAAGFGWFLLGASAFLLVSRGVIPFTSVAYYGAEIGSAIDAVLLSLALAQRMKQLKENGEKALRDQWTTRMALLAAQTDAATAHAEALAQTRIALENHQKALEVEQVALNQEKQLIEKEKLANLGLLSAGVAHEINNPNNFLNMSAQTAGTRLASLKIYVDDLLGDDPDPDIVAGFRQHFEGITSQLAIVREGSDRIAGIVKSMRKNSRNDSNVEELFDPVECLLATLDIITPTFKHVAVFRSERLQAGHRVSGFPSRLNQVFTNFIVNGCHAIEEKQRQNGTSDPGVIELSSEIAGQALVISIRDTGCGMSEAVKAKLFQPFFTTKGADKGTGLGLGICRGIVEEHHGRIEVDSVEGQGSIFRVVLPLAAS